jgi:hypothetical protein
MGQTDSAAKSGIGAPEADEIVTTRQALVVSTPQAVGACFDDWRVSGLKPPGTIVSRLIAEVLERVSRHEIRAHQKPWREPC